MSTSKSAFTKQELLNAVKNREFVLHYQPQYNLSTKKFEGIEALIRWQHPTQGLLLPDAFIPIAEKSNAIILIGEWVLRNACEQSKKWQNQGFPFLRISVNVSGKQFKQKNFPKKVRQILKDCELAPQYLELELTENIVIRDTDNHFIETIMQLKHAGVQIALDDFGVGYSGLSYLRIIPIDRIKIDKKFIKNVDINSGDAAIVRALIALANSLNISVLAEGVETLTHLNHLLSEACIEVQGFYFSEAIPANEIEIFILSYRHDEIWNDKK